MKVFISWSGTVSHQIAVVLRDWLPSVIQTLEPYVSSEDIDKGTRWSTDIAGELHASSYGVICLTKENLAAPWINFEAGALSKSVEKSRVSPFLFGVKRSEISGPLLQFQSTVVEQPDVLKLLKSINSACEKDALDDGRLEKTFEVWWPRLDSALQEVAARSPQVSSANPVEKETPTAKVLEELLELTRINHKILRDPAAMMPPGYLDQVLGRHSRDVETNVVALRDVDAFREAARDSLRSLSEELEGPNEHLVAALRALKDLEGPLSYLLRGAKKGPYRMAA
jgi:hypothetical protein